jgi:hypothetical protein
MEVLRGQLNKTLAEGGWDEASRNEVADLVVKAFKEADDAINRVVGAASTSQNEYQALVYAWLVMFRTAETKLKTASTMNREQGLTQ